MAIIYNGTEIANNYKISFNGTNLKKIYARNTALGTLRQVWPSPEILGHIDIVKTGTSAEVKILDIFKNNDFKVVSPVETKTVYYPNVYGCVVDNTLTTTAQTFTIKAKKTNALDSWSWSFGTSIWSRAFCQMIVDLNDVPEGHHQYVVERTDSEFVVNATSESESVILNSYFRGYSQNGYTALDGDFAVPRYINSISNHSANVGLLMFNGEFKLPKYYTAYSLVNTNTFFPQKVSDRATGMKQLDYYYDQYMSTYNYGLNSNLTVLGTINCMFDDRDGYYGHYGNSIIPGEKSTGLGTPGTHPQLLKVDSEQFNKFSTPIINAMEI
jgi:hypothetical protein